MDSKYSQHSHGQARANQVLNHIQSVEEQLPVLTVCPVQAAQPLLLAAVEDLASAQSSTVGPFCVGDIGCSVGNASVAELAVVVRCLDEQVRVRCASKQFAKTNWGTWGLASKNTVKPHQLDIGNLAGQRDSAIGLCNVSPPAE